MEILINGKKTAIIKEDSDDNIEYRKYMKREYNLIPCFILNKDNIPISVIDLPSSFFNNDSRKVKFIECNKTYQTI